MFFFSPPLFGRLGDFLQSTAGLLQLSQRVGRRQRRHGWVLDEWVTRVVATEVSPAADAASTPGGVSPTGQSLGVERVGLL